MPHNEQGRCWLLIRAISGPYQGRLWVKINISPDGSLDDQKQYHPLSVASVCLSLNLFSLCCPLAILSSPFVSSSFFSFCLTLSVFRLSSLWFAVRRGDVFPPGTEEVEVDSTSLITAVRVRVTHTIKTAPCIKALIYH